MHLHKWTLSTLIFITISIPYLGVINLCLTEKSIAQLTVLKYKTD